MIGYYDYTVILTYLSLLSSFLGISFVMRGGNISAALICLLISGICDMFDGKVASVKKNRTRQEKNFGIQIDSLSDVICFGVLPALIVYKMAGEILPALCLTGFFVLCGLIRLAYFNVDEQERQTQTDERREVYLGLPITSSALIIPFFVGLCLLFSWDPKYVMLPVVLAVAIAFISPFKLKKPKLFGTVFILLIGVADVVLLILGMLK